MLRRRPGLLDRDRRVGRRRARRECHVAQPSRSDGALLRRHAGHLLGPHAALRHFGGHVEIWRSTSSRRCGAISTRGRGAGPGRGIPLPPRCAARLLRPRSSSAPRAPVVALDRLVAARSRFARLLLQGSRGCRRTRTPSARSSSAIRLLTARGVPVAGEYEVKNVQAMKILDSFGAGGSFTEYYAMDFTDDVVLMGHDGPGPSSRLPRERPRCVRCRSITARSGSGLSVEMTVKHGPVTLLRSSRAPRAGWGSCWPKANRCPAPPWKSATRTAGTGSDRRARFVNEWNGHGPAHHCAVGIGHVADQATSSDSCSESRRPPSADVPVIAPGGRVCGPQSLCRRPLPLDWRAGGRQLLHPLPASAAMVVGDLLAGRRCLQLDRGAPGARLAARPRLLGDAARRRPHARCRGRTHSGCCGVWGA